MSINKLCAYIPDKLTASHNSFQIFNLLKDGCIYLCHLIFITNCEITT